MPATYEPIASVTLGVSTSSVIFNSIPQTYTDLVLVCNWQTSVDDDQLSIIFNSDSGSNYSWTQLYGNGSIAASVRYSNQSNLRIANYSTNATYFPININHIMNYSNTTTYKNVLSRWQDVNAQIALQTGLWRSSSAITSLTLTSSNSSTITLSSGSNFHLFGIKAA